MKLYLNSIIISVVTFFWSASYYIDHPYIVGNLRPYVYRLLVPLLTGGVEFFGVPSPYAMLFVMTVSGCGFYLALRTLAREFCDLNDRREIYLVVSVMICLVVFYRCYHPYDLMTAWLFTLVLYYFWTDQKIKHLLVFALACINRETAILLTLFYVAFLFPLARFCISSWINKQIALMTACQVVIYLTITISLRLMFADNPGVASVIEPLQNIQRFTSQPYWFLLHLFLASALIWWIARSWNNKQPFFRFGFILFAPILMVMYLVFGQAFEIRVFWEIVPFTILLSMPNI